MAAPTEAVAATVAATAAPLLPEDLAKVAKEEEKAKVQSRRPLHSLDESPQRLRQKPRQRQMGWGPAQKARLVGFSRMMMTTTTTIQMPL
jgi:hypothetical protein